MHAKNPRLIAARGNHTTVTSTANQNGQADEATVFKSLARDEEGVKVDMYDCFFDGFGLFYD
jgi:hypothetical protein